MKKRKAVGKIMKKSSIILVALVALLAMAWNYDYVKGHPKDYPHPDIFTLEVSCESVPAGQEATVHCSLRSTGIDTYKMNFQNGMFKIYVDGKWINEENSFKSMILKKGDRDDASFSFVPDKPGVYTVKVITNGKMDAPGAKPEDKIIPKEYSYEKSVSVNVT